MSRDRTSKRFYRAESTHDLLSYMDKGQAASNENRWTFETAWEVANKVGGIYTVIRSKAYVSTEEMGENYCLLGPYKEHCARTEVEEADFPPNSPLTTAVNAMRSQGYKAQGLSCAAVVVVNTAQRKQRIHDSVPHAVVAISRHTDSCVYYTDVGDDAISKFIRRAAGESEQGILDYNLKMAIRNRDATVIGALLGGEGSL